MIVVGAMCGPRATHTAKRDIAARGEAELHLECCWRAIEMVLIANAACEPSVMVEPMVVRDELHDAIRDAGQRDDRKRLCTLRLIQAAIRDRDSAHCTGNGEKITASEVASLLRTMIKQREDQIELDRAAGKTEAVAQTEREVDTIREFMPQLMDEPTLRSVCKEVVTEIGAAGLRDVGRTISALKKRYPGQVDLGRASCVVRGMLR
ncbi:MAG: GatB/YqeY domain-containing protein [Pseudomonadota bacterium]